MLVNKNTVHGIIAGNSAYSAFVSLGGTNDVGWQINVTDVTLDKFMIHV